MKKAECRRGPHSRAVARAVPCLLVLACAVAAQRPDDAKRETGKKLLAKMPALKAGERLTAHYENLMGPEQPIGYSSSSIIAEETSGGLVYRYELDAALRFMNNARIQATVRGTLRPSFEPIDLELRRVFTTPEGKQSIGVNRARVGDKTVLLEEGDEAGKEQKKEAPRPTSPFVFAMDLVVQRLDLSALEDFVLAEFDTQKGTAGELTFVVQPAGDGGKTLISFLSNDQPSYQFGFGADGKLRQWSEAGLPMISRVVTAERIEQLKRDLKAAAEKWEADEKAMQPKATPQAP